MRDPKRDPWAGDLLQDGDFSFEVLRVYRDEKGRRLVAFVQRWIFDGEKRSQHVLNGIGGWRHRWGTNAVRA